MWIADSNLRRVNEAAIYAQTDCAVGAKVGHLANSLKFVHRTEYKCAVVMAGLNNIVQETPCNDSWINQTQQEVNKLKTNMAKFNKSVIVGVPPAPWTEVDNNTKKMRDTINKQLAKVAGEIKATFVPLDQQEDEEEENWEDSRHMSDKYTAVVVGKVADAVEKMTGENLLVRNTPLTVQRKHSKVRNTCRLGCVVCTQIGHGSCAKTKRKTCSGSETPNGKK